MYYEAKKMYVVINVVVLLCTIILFMCSYSNVKEIFSNSSEKIIMTLIITVMIVNGLKAFRLYFALYGKSISLAMHLKQYCKVLPVSVIVPFKLGDVFRAYCYGYQTSNYFGGIIVVLLDRFADSLALVTMIFFLKIIKGTEFTILFYILLIFLVSVIISYLIFPSMYRYWKHYFLKSNTSKGKMQLIKILDKLHEAYIELEIVVKGRCLILYVISIIAWSVEIGGLIISNGISDNIVFVVSEYLTSALFGAESDYLKQFVWISIVIVIVIYISLHCVIFIRKRLKSGKYNRCI